MTTAMVNEVIEAALGGTTVTTTVEGRERYPIRVRYQRDLREEIEQLEELPVVTSSGEVVPLRVLAKMSMVWGPEMVASEDARLVAHVMFSPSGDFGDLETAQAVENTLREAMSLPVGDPLRLELPPGYFVQAVGSFQSQIETNQRLMWVIPLVLITSLMIIYFEFRDPVMTLIIMAPVPVTFSGGMIALALTGVEMNTAIWIGFISLLGIAEDDGVLILTYLRQVFNERKPRTVGHPRRDDRCRAEADSPRLDDDRHHVCRSRAGADRDRSRRRSGPRDGDAARRRNDLRPDRAVYRPGPVLRLHGVPPPDRMAA
jgi:Cu(I)/Ag(I) efflux system membrane protein CusA/SilA